MAVTSVVILVSPNLGDLCISNEHGFLLESRKSPIVWSWTSLSGVLVGQGSWNRSLKTKARVRVKA